MMLKFWAFIWRRTGFLHSSLEVANYRHLKRRIREIEKQYIEALISEPDNPLSFSDIVSVTIGSYDVELGLTVNYKYLEFGTESFMKKVLIRIRRLLDV